MTTLHELIDTHFDPDPDVTTSAVFAAAGVPEKWRALFYGVVRDECRRSARNVVRHFERAKIDQPGAIDFADPTRLPPPVGYIAGVAVHLSHTMFCGLKHGDVVKGSATVEQWEARAEYLSAQIAGTTRTMNECMAVADALRSAKVECVNELMAVAA